MNFKKKLIRGKETKVNAISNLYSEAVVLSQTSHSGCAYSTSERVWDRVMV